MTATVLVAVSVNAPTSDEVVTVRVDGQPVMQVDSAGETSAMERGRQVERRIKGCRCDAGKCGRKDFAENCR